MAQGQQAYIQPSPRQRKTSFTAMRHHSVAATRPEGTRGFSARLLAPENMDFSLVSLKGEHITIQLHVAGHGLVIDVVRQR